MSFNLDEQFDELKNEYLHSITDDLDQIEGALVKDDVSKDDVKEIFRTIHSLKGGASSHEMTVIGTICHHFEDYISAHLSNDITSQNIDHCLKYVDLLRNITRDYRDKKDINFQQCQDALAELRIGDVEESIEYKGRVLIVEGTTTMANIIKKGLSMSGYDCTLTKNGLAAFNRLITEKFDILVTSLNIEQLDGISLITATKATNNVNANIPSIVISASTNIKDRFPREFRPSFVVEKNTELMNNLNSILEKVMAGEEDGANEDLSGPEKILYVEDDPRMQKLFGLAMKKHSNVEVEFASNREEAIRKCKSFKPDVLLLDNFLKGCTGQDIFNDVLDMRIPSIFLTASEAAVDVKALGKHKEFLGIITKPFRPGAIYGQVSRFYKNK
jgi:CheY-like chemotaxis protein